MNPNVSEEINFLKYPLFNFLRTWVRSDTQKVRQLVATEAVEDAFTMLTLAAIGFLLMKSPSVNHTIQLNPLFRKYVDTSEVIKF